MATSTIPVVPLADRVVILPAEKEEEVSASGIIISSLADTKEKPSKGTVVAVGPGHYENGTLVPVGVSVGDVVFFSKYKYEEVSIENKEYYILAAADLLAIIK